MSRANYGTVVISIGDESYTLVPTLKAMTKIETNWPAGLRGAIDACHSMSPNSISFIIAAGAGLSKEDAKALPEAVFSEGTARLAPKVMEYLTKLINPSGKEDDEESEPGE